MMADKSVISNLPVERVLSERPLSECGGRVHPLLRAVSEPLLGWWSNRVTLPPILSDCQIRSHQVFPSIMSSQHHTLHHTPHIPPYHSLSIALCTFNTQQVLFTRHWDISPKSVSPKRHFTQKTFPPKDTSPKKTFPPKDTSPKKTFPPKRHFPQKDISPKRLLHPLPNYLSMDHLWLGRLGSLRRTRVQNLSLL